MHANVRRMIQQRHGVRVANNRSVMKWECLLDPSGDLHKGFIHMLSLEIPNVLGFGNVRSTY